MFEPALSVDPAEVFPGLTATIDALPGRAARGGTATESDLRVRSLLTLSRRVEALLLAEVAAFDDQGFALACGAKSTGSYLAAHAHLDPAAARRLVVAARTADRLPQLGSMLSAGDIGTDHVAAVGFSTSRLPAEVVASQDAVFAALASSAQPAQLRAAGQHLQAMYDTDAASRDANHVRDSRYLTVAQTFGGAWHLEGLLPPEDGVALSLVLDSLSTKAGAEDDRTATQRRADALVEMTTLTLRTGELPDTGGDQPHVTLLVQAKPNPFAEPEEVDSDEGWGDECRGGEGRRDEVDPDRAAASLARGLHDIAGASTGSGAGAAFSVTAFDLSDAQLLASTTGISRETLQRICCDAQFNITTMDATGNILNQGRAVREPNLAQRRAVKIRDKHCVFPGCDVPAHRCQVHHVHYWRNGGCTDLCNLALVCLFHHQLVHEHRWTLATAPPTPDHPAGGWRAIHPDGREYRQFRERAA
ncbi:HNH endonuclease signature motif containing protein [Acidothermaceae bacterium B102]|nr:HNH endonuclease signature motif containing protein [Acidothermaceae bacterium B102]